MTQHATIVSEVVYRPGDGALMEIPKGPVEVDLAPDSATLSWMDDNGAASVAAIPLTLYKKYVHDRKIVPRN